MRVLVTGHTGFIGSNLSRLLKGLGHEVVGCSRKTNCDLLRISDLKPFVNDCELAFHLAADAKPAESLITPWETFEVNTEMSIKVALACRDANVPLIYCSSCEIYGDSSSAITEETPIMPTNPYAASKAACDRVLYSFYRSYNADIKIARLFNPYGPNQQINKIIPTFYRQGKANRPLTVYGKGDDYRDYVYVEDIVRGLWEAGRLKAGEVINLATAIKTRTIDVANLIIEKTGSKSTVEFTPYPKLFGGIRYQVGSYAKAKNMLGWEPRVNLKDGLDLTIKWLESVGK